MKFTPFVAVAAAVSLLCANTGLATPAPQKIPTTIAESVRRQLMAMDPTEYRIFDRAAGFDSSSLTERGAQLSELRTRCTGSKCLSMTFDDGPYIHEKKIVDTLDKAGMKGTFFVNGNNYQCIYDSAAVTALRYTYEHGHQICSHTWSHPNLQSLSNSQIDTQVRLVEEALYKILGIIPACIRAPYGSISDAQVQYLNDRWGLVVIGWNFDTQDANGYGTEYGLNVYRSLKAPKHAIVLNHETVPGTSKTVIPQAVKIVRQNGYSGSQTVASTLSFNPYKVVGKYGTRDSSWTCDGKPQPGSN